MDDSLLERFAMFVATAECSAEIIPGFMDFPDWPRPCCWRIKLHEEGLVHTNTAGAGCTAKIYKHRGLHTTTTPAEALRIAKTAAPWARSSTTTGTRRRVFL